MRTPRPAEDNPTAERRQGSSDASDSRERGVALVVVVDDLERIVELHGPAGLTEVLGEAGRRIRQTLRSDDSTMRWGGEELVVILRDVSIDGAVEVGQRIRIAVSQPLTFGDGRSMVPTCSVGCAAGNPEDLEELVGRAKQALGSAKASGGNSLRRALAVEGNRTAGV
ncbi:MAG TPA: GGDEF domain-containing protein [Acidimicrobiales bacterium]|nr:GGDEF domain-containing protein [Acidimicrobiales bacterium]